MPIDLTLLRPSSEEGKINLVRQWQTLRQPLPDRNENSSSESLSQPRSDDGSSVLLSTLARNESERRATIRELNGHRATLNQLLGRRRSGTDGHDLASKSAEIGNIRLVIKSLETKLDDLTFRIERLLPQVGNEVDTTLFRVDDDQINDSTHANERLSPANKELVIDPFYCIGGYETLSNQKAVLSGVGSGLAKSLSNYAISFLQHQQQKHYKMSHVPSNDASFVSKELAHSVMGCTRASGAECSICNVADTKMVKVPTYISMSLLHQNKSYSEKKSLPLRYVCLSAGNYGPVRPKENCGHPNYTHPMERIELFALCDSILSASRQIQDDFAQTIVEFHHSLLRFSISNLSSSLLDSSRYEKLIRARTTPPSAYRPSECRRIVVEGYLPSMNRYVQLGYASNHTDFISRGLKTKCGTSAHTTRTEYVYTLHGVLCDVSTTLSWLVEHGVADGGVLVSKHLSTFIPQYSQNDPTSSDCVFIPFKCRLKRNKHGKIVMHTITDFKQHNHRSKKKFHENHNEMRKDPSSEKTSELTTKGNMHGIDDTTQHIDHLASEQEIAAEAMCNPFDFLPLGQR